MTVVLAATTILSTASVALAADTVPNKVYGVPACERGVALGNKHCTPADVPTDNNAAGAIVKSVESGIMNGYEDGTFQPARQLTNAEAVTVMLRVLGLKPEVGQGNNWTQPVITQAANLGLTSANTDPNVPMTRAGMAVLIAKALKIEPLKGDAKAPFNDISGLDEQTQGLLAALYKAGVFEGYPDGTFAPDRSLSRAEMALLIERILSKFKPQ